MYRLLPISVSSTGFSINRLRYHSDDKDILDIGRTLAHDEVPRGLDGSAIRPDFVPRLSSVEGGSRLRLHRLLYLRLQQQPAEEMKEKVVCRFARHSRPRKAALERNSGDGLTRRAY